MTVSKSNYEAALKSGASAKKAGIALAFFITLNLMSGLNRRAAFRPVPEGSCLSIEKVERVEKHSMHTL